VEAIVEEILGLHPSGWTLVQQATQTILRLAGLGRSIVVGRGGNIITARLPNVFHVRLVAPLVTRIRHCAEYYHLSEAEAAKLVREQDQARRRYLRRYFNAKIDSEHWQDGFRPIGRGYCGGGFAAPPGVCRARRKLKGFRGMSRSTREDRSVVSTLVDRWPIRKAMLNRIVKSVDRPTKGSLSIENGML
jgi:hypothetical protein